MFPSPATRIHSDLVFQQLQNMPHREKALPIRSLDTESTQLQFFNIAGDASMNPSALHTPAENCGRLGFKVQTNVRSDWELILSCPLKQQALRALLPRAQADPCPSFELLHNATSCRQPSLTSQARLGGSSLRLTASACTSITSRPWGPHHNLLFPSQQGGPEHRAGALI